MIRQICQHLQDEPYYNELYDHLTVEECQRWEEKSVETLLPANDDARKAEIQKEYPTNFLIPLSLYFLKGERYRNKSQTIREWAARDRQLDEKIINAVAPSGIRCLGCSSLMDCTARDLHTDSDDKKDKVLFFFECPKCHKRRAYWDGGEEWEPNPDPCRSCKTHMESNHSRKGNGITTLYSCPYCGYKETERWSLNEKKEESVDPCFEANRKKYCLSDKEGMEYISRCEDLKHLTDMMRDRRENKEVYEAVAKIKKLTIAELHNLLNPLIEHAGYTKFELGKPEIRKDVVVEFTLQDNKLNRREYDSSHTLQKLIKKALDGTNWRLMSDGISYRLGFLSGHLRGVEGEERLRELVTKEAEKTRQS